MPNVSEFPSQHCFPTVTIASGQTVSGAIDLNGTVLVGVILPAALTSVALKFQASADNSTFVAVADGAGADVSKTVAAGKYVGLDPIQFRGVRWLKLVGGSAEGADRIITLVTRPVG